MKRIILLNLLATIINISSMDLTKYCCTNEIEKPEDLYLAIKENDYNSIYHTFRNNKKANFAYDNNEVEKLCDENIKRIENSSSSIANFFWGLTGSGSLAFYSWFQYQGAYNTRHMNEVSDDTFFGCELASGIFAAVGLVSIYNLVTNNSKKQAILYAAGIKQLVVKPQIDEEKNTEKESV